MLYLIGLGLCNEKDISVKGYETIKKCSKVYLEEYTSLMSVSKETLETFYGKDIISAPRILVENASDRLIEEAKKEDVAILIVGDPLSATTHTSLLLDAKKKGIEVQVIHNASVLTTVGQTGLQLYKFGRVASISFHPSDVPYEILGLNKKAGLHTLFLLDLDPVHKKAITCSEAVQVLLQLESKHHQKLLTDNTLAVGCARLGWPTQRIICGTLKELSLQELGDPPHCLIIPGELHFLEQDWLKEFSCVGKRLQED